MTVREHWPQWYKDLYNADTERKRSRLVELVEKAHSIGQLNTQARLAGLAKAETVGDVEVFGSMIKMDKFLRGRL